MSRKGVALPIEMIVIVAIAVLVLVVLAAFFLGGFRTQPISDSAAFSQGCLILRIQRNCNADPANIFISGYTIPGQVTDGNLLQACERTNNGATSPDCRVACGCPR